MSARRRPLQFLVSGLLLALASSAQAQTRGPELGPPMYVSAIVRVHPGSPAALAGLQPYDMILFVNGRRVGMDEQLREALQFSPVAELLVQNLITGRRTLIRVVPVRGRIGIDVGQIDVSPRHNPRYPRFGPVLP